MNTYQNWIYTNLHQLAQEYFGEEVNEGHEFVQNKDFRKYCEQEAEERVADLSLKY